MVIELLHLKSQKRESRQLIDFLEGAQSILESVCGKEQFNVENTNLGLTDSYKEALNVVSKRLQLQKEERHSTILKGYSAKKLMMINYFCNLGKLKAMFKVFQVKNKIQETIEHMFNKQIAKLSSKLEQIDIMITEELQQHIIKRGLTQQYYRDLGRMAVIKCGIKGLDFSHIFDYLALEMLKQRTSEASLLFIDIKIQQEKSREVDSARGSEPSIGSPMKRSNTSSSSRRPDS